MTKWEKFKNEVKEEVKMLWKPVVAGTVIAFLAIGVATGVKAATKAVENAYKDFKKAEKTLNKNGAKPKFLDRGTPTYTVKKADWYVKECMEKQNLWLTYIYVIRYGVNINSEQLERLANLVTRESYEYKKFITENPNAWQTQGEDNSDYDYENNIPFLAYPKGTTDCEMPKEVFEKKLDVKLLNMIEAERKKGKSLL